MIPCQRASTSCDTTNLIATHIGRDSLIERFAAVATIVVVAFRNEAGSLTHALNQAPLHAGHQVPALALCLAILACVVHIQRCRRVNAAKRVCTAILHDVLVLGNVDCVHFLPVDDERRMHGGGFAHAQLLVGHLRILTMMDGIPTLS